MILSSLITLPRRTLILAVMAVAIAAAIAIPLARSVGAGGFARSRHVTPQSPTKGKGISLGQVQSSKKEKIFPNVDIRVTEPATVLNLIGVGAPGVASRLNAQRTAIGQGLSSLRQTSPGADIRLSPVSGAVETLRNKTGPLTEAAPGRDGVGIVRDFISRNAGVFGFKKGDVSNLRYLGESVSKGSGLRMVRVEQVVNGRPVFQSETRFILDEAGQLVYATGALVPDATASAQRTSGALISAQDALAHSMALVEVNLDAANATVKSSSADGNEVEIEANDENIAGPVLSKLVYFPIAPGMLTLAWSQTVFTDGNSDWYTVTDAQSGKLLWRKNLRANVSTHNARFRVYVQADGTTPADSPAPLSPSNVVVGSGTQGTAISPTIVSMFTAMSAVASPNGWIDDCSTLR